MAARKIYCARCGRRLQAGGGWIFSRFTRSHYCTNLDTCSKRAKSRRKAAAR